MMVSQTFKKIANVAENPIGIVGNHVTDVTTFIFSMGRRTVTTSSKPTTITHPNTETSLMANMLLWTHLIPPMPLIASTMYRHYFKGNTS
jgi:hypothetical protein